MEFNLGKDQKKWYINFLLWSSHMETSVYHKKKKKILRNSFNEISFQEHIIKGYYHFSLSSTL